MDLAFVHVIVLLHTAFAGVFFFLNWQYPSRFSRLFAWCWIVEGVRASILLPAVHNLGGWPVAWFSLGDVLCFVANWCLLAGFADLVGRRLPRWLAPAYLWTGISLVLLSRYAVAPLLHARMGLRLEDAEFSCGFFNTVVMFAPVTVARLFILSWLYDLWRSTRMPGAAIATIFAVPYALVAAIAPVQYWFSYIPDWITLLWSARVLGFSVGLVILMLNRQQAAAKESEAGLADAQALARLGSWRFDAITGAGTWSAEMFRLCGRDPSGGAPDHDGFLALIHPDDRDLVREGEARARTAGDGNEFEVRLVPSAGGICWISIRCHPIRSADGRLIGLHGTAQDVTERRLAGNRIRQLNRLYAVLSDVNQMIVRERDLEKLFAAVCAIAVERDGFRVACIGLVEADPPRLTLAAHAASGSGGHQEHESFLAGTVGAGTCLQTARAVATGAHAVCNDIAQETEAPTWRTAALQLDIRSMVACPLRVDGRIFGTFNLYAGEPHFFDDTELRLLDELAADISFAVEVSRRDAERQQLQVQLAQAQRLEAIGRLVAGIAHDFNNVLWAICLQIELQLADKTLTAKQRDSLCALRSFAQHGSGLTRQLLLFSRQQPLQKQDIELNATIADLLAMLQRLAGPDVAIEFTPAAFLPHLVADPTMVEQVVMNLVLNARDAMPGGGRIVIATGTTDRAEASTGLASPARPGRYARMSVSDSGTGMSDEVRKRIFEPFFTTKTHGKGMGLGLATVLGIVQEHSGWIDVESQPGRGSVFHVHLPLSAPGSGTADDSPVGAEQLRHAPQRVLLVDDDDAIRAALTQALQSKGYDVIQASGGERALRLWKECGGGFNLLIADLKLRDGMGGVEIARLLRIEAPRLGVVLMGANAGAHAGEAARTGNFGFLAKPFDIATFLEKVRTAGAA